MLHNPQNAIKELHDSKMGLEIIIATVNSRTKIFCYNYQPSYICLIIILLRLKTAVTVEIDAIEIKLQQTNLMCG